MRLATTLTTKSPQWDRLFVLVSHARALNLNRNDLLRTTLCCALNVIAAAAGALANTQFVVMVCPV